MRGAEAAFYIVFTLAVVLGGAQALNGVPVLLGLIVPSGVAKAEASVPEREPEVRLSIAGPHAGSAYEPQVLYPVATQEYPDWLEARRVMSAGAADGPPKIAIVIDDLGADLARTDRAMALPKEVALSFLPYADASPWLSAEAARKSHEVLLHMPMEAEGEHNPGPDALTVGLAPAEILRRLDAALARVPGAIGINNHMGSRFTADRTGLVAVAEDLARRHLLFFDSRTTTATQVVPVARAFGVASAGRDVFLDDEETAGAVQTQLAELEARARAQGVAIAIGHPHDVTLQALAQWTSRAQARGFVLIPLAEAIRLKTSREARLSLSAR
jgi:uncharacterized protein